MTATASTPGYPAPGQPSYPPGPNYPPAGPNYPPPGPNYPPPGGSYPPPPGGPSWTPGPPGRPDPRRRRAVVWLIALFAVAIVAGALVAVLVTRSSGDVTPQAGEVFLEPISTVRDPFTDPTGRDVDLSKAPVPSSAATTAASGGSGATSAATATSSTTAGTSYPTTGIVQRLGGEPGLYGGTMREGACDKAQLVSFLQQNPAKAAAWSSVLGITPADIGSYVNRLTPVVLRGDTRVTNHGFADGAATPLQSVLQAGTAVLVDTFGRPTTKCYCGNPLAPPVASPPLYTGQRWPSFDKGNLTVINKHLVELTEFVLVDVKSGQSFTRTAGSGDASQDKPLVPANGSTTTSTTGPTTTSSRATTTTAPPSSASSTTGAPSASVEGSYTLTGAVAAGSDASCTASEGGTLTVKVQGSGPNRQITLADDNGNGLSGALHPDNTFVVNGPVPDAPGGTQTISGTFRFEGSTIKVSGTSTLDLDGAHCNFSFTGQRFP